MFYAQNFFNCIKWTPPQQYSNTWLLLHSNVLLWMICHMNKDRTQEEVKLQTEKNNLHWYEAMFHFATASALHANRKYVKRKMNNKNASNTFIIVNIHALYSNTQYNLLTATGQLDHLQSHVERAQANLICPRMLHLFLCFWCFYTITKWSLNMPSSMEPLCTQKCKFRGPSF